MENILNTYPVYYGDLRAGELEITRSGLMYAFTGRCDRVSAEVMRLWVVSGGKFISIGVLMPSGGRLCLNKKFTRSALETMGITEISRCVIAEAGTEMSAPIPDKAKEQERESAPERETARSEDGWQIEREPWRFFARPELSDACCTIETAWSKTRGSTSYLAVPLEADKPFPLISMICHGTPDTVNSQPCLVFKIPVGGESDR